MNFQDIAYTKKWSDMSWDQLVKYHSIVRGDGSEMSELMERMQEFEIVSGLSVKGLGVLPWEEKPKEMLSVIKWMEKELGDGGSYVWLKKEEGRGKKDERLEVRGERLAVSEEILVMTREEFARTVRCVTAWMEKKEGLLKLPEQFVVVAGETFALPTLVGNDDRVVRYGQYGDMQMYMIGIAGVMNKVAALNDHKQKEAMEAGLLDQLRMYRNGFLSCLLLPTVIEEMKVDDVNEKSGYRWVSRRRVVRYDRGMRERIAEKMDQSPTWLFSMLWHLVQSCLAYYHGRFPELVSGGKTSKSQRNTDMYVAKLGTDNAVMKYAGYPSVTAVNDEPMGVILERLDAMAKESKEWEKARRRK